MAEEYISKTKDDQLDVFGFYCNDGFAKWAKKVLSAFGTSAEEIATEATMKNKSNAQLIASLQQNAKEQPGKYGEKYKMAQKLNNKTKEFSDYMKNLKNEILKIEFKGKIPKEIDYELLSGSATVDNMFFKKGKPTAKGKEFEKKVDEYRNYLQGLSIDGNPLNEELKKTIYQRFNTDDIKHGKKGKRIEPWLMANFEGFPTVATLFKLDNYVNKAKATENEILSTAIGGQMKKDVSVTNYEPVVVLDKSAYFPGEKVKGKVALGRVDSTLSFKEVIINGKPVSKNLLTKGYVQLELPAGNVGEKVVNGKMVFVEEGKDVELPFEIPYAVIPRPNSAVISADKMNVVYRGVENPMSISFPGVPDNKVSVSIPGANYKKEGTGKYMVNVTNYKGREIKINVTGKINGQTVSDSKHSV